MIKAVKHNREQVAVLKWWQEFKEQEQKGSLSAKFFRLELENRFTFLKENGYAQ